MTFKKKVFDHCVRLLEEKISSLQNILRDLEEGAQSDSKSSAGDKHETARAMMQLEQEKIRKQLSDALSHKAALEKTGFAPNDRIKPGSLIGTNKGFLYLGVVPEKIRVDEKNIYVLTPISPLGKKLLGLGVGDKAEMNGSVYMIESIE